MDFVCHALVGASIGELAPRRISNRQLKGALAGMSPDIMNVFSYFYLGFRQGNPIPIASAEDFKSNPWIVDHWTWIPWEISHSFLFWGLFVMPLIFLFRAPVMIGLAYLSHLILDLPSHTGIWSAVPLYPIQIRYEGWFDAWAWSAEEIILWATIPFLAWRACAVLRSPENPWLVWRSEISPIKE